MEAIEFLREYSRMCSTSIRCQGCPLSEKPCLSAALSTVTDDNIKTIVSSVEWWSKENPLVTNKMKIREVFGDEAIYAISSPNVQDLKNWLDEPYKEPNMEK